MGKVFDNTTDLGSDKFATISAIKGKQFGREVYSSVIKFKDLERFLEIFPSVQRDIIPRKVASIRRYILTGLDNDSLDMRFFSAVTVTCRGFMFYDEINHRVAIDTRESRLSVNDGQHRHLAIKSAIEYLEKEFVASKKKEKTAKLKRMIDELNEMVLPIVIFNGLTEREESQLFFDLNNLAQRPSKNANIRLNQSDIFSRLTRQIAQENRYLKHYGVEYDKMSIHHGNPNTILLSTIYSSIKEILGAEYKQDKAFLNEDNYERFRKFIDDTLNSLFFALPADINTKNKYLTDKSYTIRAMTKFICHARNNIHLQLSDEAIFDIIKSVDWTYNIDFWSKYNGVKGDDHNIVFGGGSNGGFRAVYDALIERAMLHDVKTQV